MHGISDDIKQIADRIKNTIKNSKSLSLDTDEGTVKINKNGISVNTPIPPTQSVSISTEPLWLKYAAIGVPIVLFILSRGKK
jgi:hypothetical protein